MSKKITTSPPGFVMRFLEWFCPAHLFEGIEGDVVEQFDTDVHALGIKRARLRLIWRVIGFFRPGIILRNRLSWKFMNGVLIRNYAKVSYRNLARNKTFAAVNILGLATGLAAALLVYEYVSFEKSYDDFHGNAANIYRVTTSWNKTVTPDDKRATTVPWSGPGVKEAFPEVLEYTRYAPLTPMSGEHAFTYGDQKLSETSIYLVDPGFLKIFSFPLLSGDPRKAFEEPNHVIITSSIASKYFNGKDPVGEMLYMNAPNLTESNFRIVGVMQDPPENSHMKFDFLVSYRAIPQGLENGSTYWHWDFTYCYLLLHPDADAKALENKITELRVSRFGKEFNSWTDVIDFKLQRLTDIHLFSSLRGEALLNGDGRSLYFLTLVGLCILLSAYINYINLSTVKAVERKTEIGVRKVIGSSRSQLILQLLVESAVINGIALVIAVVLARISTPLIGYLFNIRWPSWDVGMLSPGFLLTAAGIFCLGILLSALYPAFVMTSFKPVEVLKGGNASGSGRRLTLRKFLIVMQFVFCLAFTSGTFVMYRQLNFMKEHDLGMNMEQVVVVKGYGFQSGKVYTDFKERLGSSSLISSIGFSSVIPGDEVIMLGLKPKIAIGDSPEQQEVKIISVDEDFFRTLDIHMLAGRNFDRSRVTDNDAVILNEAAAKLLGYDEAPNLLQKPVKGIQEKPNEVIGVISNYHQRSLKNSYEPMVFVPHWAWDVGWNKRYFLVRLKAGNNPADRKDGIQEAVSGIEGAWKATVPDQPFNYFFLDSNFDHQYKADTTFGSLFLFFSVLVIFIACLGLFGLVAYTTLQRTKEIGIRKVLGASVQNILVLLSRDFISLIIIAAFITTPLVWYGLKQWLESYAFRIDLNAFLFLYPFLLIFILSLITIIWKSVKAAVSNPVDSIRYE